MFGKFKQRWSDSTAFYVEKELRKSHGLAPQVTQLPCHRRLGARHLTLFFELNGENSGIFVQYCDKDEVLMFVAGPGQEPKVDSLPLPKRASHTSIAANLAEMVRTMEAASDLAKHQRETAILTLFGGQGDESDEVEEDVFGTMMTVSKWNDYETFPFLEDLVKAIAARLDKKSFPGTTPSGFVKHAESEDASKWFVDSTPYISFNTMYGGSKVIYITKDNENPDAFGTWTARKDVMDENYEFISTSYDWEFTIREEDVDITNGVKEVAAAILEFANRVSFGDLRDK